jgi:hypothetical protein
MTGGNALHAAVEAGEWCSLKSLTQVTDTAIIRRANRHIIVYLREPTVDNPIPQASQGDAALVNDDGDLALHLAARYTAPMHVVASLLQATRPDPNPNPEKQQQRVDQKQQQRVCS